MKKLYLLLVLVLSWVGTYADPVEINGIYYNLIPKGMVAEVTSNPNKYTESVDIPETVSYYGEDYGVTAIGSRAFQGCKGLTSVTIPNSVTSIGDYAFSGCRGLNSMTIPNSVTSIGESAFEGCSGLTSVTIGNSVTTIGDCAFKNCSGLNSVTIPNSVTSIGEEAFNWCSGLNSVTIPNSVTSIGGYAFGSCSCLTSVTIPNSVTSIGEYAFRGCNGLTSVTIGNSVSSIGGGAFYDCSSLASVTIPNSVTFIRNNAFRNCSSLISVTIGSSIKNIGSQSFANCPLITDVYCQAKRVPTTENDAFLDSYIEYATLHVPQALIDTYNAKEPWKNFKQIVSLEGGDIPEPEQCAKPTISYSNGKLTFSCATDGAEFVSEITDTDIKKNYTSEVQLTATYHISVYATKTGCNNSEVAEATLCWIDVEPQKEGFGEAPTAISITQVNAQPVLIQTNNGTISIEGAAEGTTISIYDTNGVLEGQDISHSGMTIIPTSLKPGAVAIVKVGEKAVKVIMK